MKKLLSLLMMLVSAICFGDARSQAEELIKFNEGFRAEPKHTDIETTIGYGFTASIYTSRKKMTVEEADEILHMYVEDIDKYLDKVVPVPLTVNQRVALIDFVYQYGKTKFLNSYLRSLIIVKANNSLIVKELSKYCYITVKDEKVFVTGLYNRTQRRIELWLK